MSLMDNFSIYNLKSNTLDKAEQSMTPSKLLLFFADTGSDPCNHDAGKILVTWQPFSTLSPELI